MTGPSGAPSTPKEIYAAQKVEEFSEELALGFQPRVYFTDTNKDGKNAWAAYDYVGFYKPFINGLALVDISWVAAHETCHLAGYSEAEAPECQRRLHEDA